MKKHIPPFYKKKPRKSLDLTFSWLYPLCNLSYLKGIYPVGLLIINERQTEGGDL